MPGLARAGLSSLCPSPLQQPRAGASSKDRDGEEEMQRTRTHGGWRRAAEADGSRGGAADDEGQGEKRGERHTGREYGVLGDPAAPRTLS